MSTLGGIDDNTDYKNKMVNKQCLDYQNKLKSIKEKWDSSPLLEDVYGTEKIRMSLILDNHLGGHFSSLAKKVYTNLPIFKLVGCQPTLGSNDDIFYLKFLFLGEEISLEMESEKVVLQQRNLIENIYSEDELAEKIQKNITKEVLTDLLNNVGTSAIFPISKEEKTLKEIYEEIYVKIMEVSSVMHRKTLRGSANTLFVGKSIGKILSPHQYFLKPGAEYNDDIYISYLGTLHGKWRTFVCEDIPSNQILLAYRGDSDYDCGYFYNPHSLVIEDNMICQRYSKKLIQNGPKFYAKIICEGL